MTEWESLKISRKNYDKLKQIQEALNSALSEKAKLSLDDTIAIVLLAGGTQFID